MIRMDRLGGCDPMSITLKELGERIREARKAAKMSQEELAQGVRVRRQTIGEYENGGERKSPENRFIRSLGFDS